MSFLRWNQSDFAAMGPYSNPSNPTYPYLTLEWNSENASNYGVGVIQANSTAGKYSDANYFYLPPFQNILQWLLANDPDVKTFPWVNDGQGYDSGTLGDVTLPQLLSYMLSPASPATGAPAVPYTNLSGRFNPARVWCLNPSSSNLRYLPLVNKICGAGGSNPFVGFYTVLPPYGYVNTGIYATAYSDPLKKYLYPGSELQFVLKDPRFCQPAANGYYANGSYQSYAMWNSNPFKASVTQQVMGSSTPQTFSYQYAPLAGILTWPGWKTTGYTMNTYPNDLPWAINQQLLRWFPNGPRNTFSNLVLERWIWSGSSSCQSGGSSINVYASNPRQHPCFLMTYSGTQTFPVVVYWGLYNILSCCTTQVQFSDFVWNFQAYQLPNGVSSSVTNLNQAICLAGGQGSFNYVPGTDCDLATSAYCDPSQAAYTTKTCSCYNTNAMLAAAGITEPITDPSVAQLADTLTANITCVYTDCMDAGSFKPSLYPGVLPGKSCPPFQNCSISGNTANGGNIGKLENNCSTSGSSAPVSSLTAAQWIMIVASILFVVIVFLLLIERHNRKKLGKQLKKASESSKQEETQKKEA